MVLRCFVLVCGLLISGVGAVSAAPGQSVVVGVDVVNTQPLSAAAKIDVC